MQTVTLQKNVSAPSLSPAYIKKVKKLIQMIQADTLGALQDLSPADKQSLLRGLQDVLEGRVQRVR